MDLVGEFQKMEIDGKPFLVYHNVMKPLPQIHSLKSSSKITIDSNDELPFQPLFLCPRFRTGELLDLVYINRAEREVFSKYSTSPLFDDTSNGHHVLPLFWCNNKEADPEGECYTCKVPKFGTSYYFCVECDKRFHKECVESPLEISYPSHPKHSLQLYYARIRSDYCSLCRERATYLVYYCSLCATYIHALCAKATIPFFIDQPKRHDHILTLFPRQACLTCNVCGLVSKLHLTYVCRSICDFVAHVDCIYIPQTIRTSRHPHRISFISSLSLKKLFCGVCRREVDNDNGAYTCNMCSGYAVHTRCALRRGDIWDGTELEGVPEEEEEVVESFKRIDDGVILHFSHPHPPRFETSGIYDANKFCQACVLPIYEGNFYVCVECDFIQHETCAEAPRKMFHPLHPHPLQLEAAFSSTGSALTGFPCSVCTCLSTGFVYWCPNKDCCFQLDIRCAFASEPFTYQGHLHPLFLALDPKEKPRCHICKSTDDHKKVLNCIECDFIICFECATLPYMARYKHDEHYLTFCLGDEANDSDWCELCEAKLAIGGEKGFYKCNYCCTTLHINCLLGIEPYLKCGRLFPTTNGGEVHVLRNNSSSRPVCRRCDRRCMYPTIFVSHEDITFCSLKCYDDQFINH